MQITFGIKHSENGQGTSANTRFCPWEGFLLVLVKPHLVSILFVVLTTLIHSFLFFLFIIYLYNSLSFDGWLVVVGGGGGVYS